MTCVLTGCVVGLLVVVQGGGGKVEGSLGKFPARKEADDMPCWVVGRAETRLSGSRTMCRCSDHAHEKIVGEGKNVAEVNAMFEWGSARNNVQPRLNSEIV
jgi:hypothetical protein